MAAMLLRNVALLLLCSFLFFGVRRGALGWLLDEDGFKPDGLRIVIASPHVLRSTSSSSSGAAMGNTSFPQAAALVSQRRLYEFVSSPGHAAWMYMSIIGNEHFRVYCRKDDNEDGAITSAAAAKTQQPWEDYIATGRVWNYSMQPAFPELVPVPTSDFADCGPIEIIVKFSAGVRSDVALRVAPWLNRDKELALEAQRAAKHEDPSWADEAPGVLNGFNSVGKWCRDDNDECFMALDGDYTSKFAVDQLPCREGRPELSKSQRPPLPLYYRLPIQMASVSSLSDMVAANSTATDVVSGVNNGLRKVNDEERVIHASGASFVTAVDTTIAKRGLYRYYHPSQVPLVQPYTARLAVALTTPHVRGHYMSFLWDPSTGDSSSSHTTPPPGSKMIDVEIEVRRVPLRSLTAFALPMALLFSFLVGPVMGSVFFALRRARQRSMVRNGPVLLDVIKEYFRSLRSIVAGREGILSEHRPRDEVVGLRLSPASRGRALAAVAKAAQEDEEAETARAAPGGAGSDSQRTPASGDDALPPPLVAPPRETPLVAAHAVVDGPAPLAPAGEQQGVLATLRRFIRDRGLSVRRYVRLHGAAAEGSVPTSESTATAIAVPDTEMTPICSATPVEPAATADSADASVVCRICFSEEPVDDLFAPCSCRGTSKYVHKDCLRHWREETNNPDHRRVCAECKAPYRVEAVKLSTKATMVIVLDSVWRAVCPIFTLAAAIVVIGYIAKLSLAVVHADFEHIYWGLDHMWHYYLGVALLISTIFGAVPCSEAFDHLSTENVARLTLALAVGAPILCGLCVQSFGMLFFAVPWRATVWYRSGCIGFLFLVHYILPNVLRRADEAEFRRVDEEHPPQPTPTRPTSPIGPTGDEPFPATVEEIGGTRPAETPLPAGEGVAAPSAAGVADHDGDDSVAPRRPAAPPEAVNLDRPSDASSMR